MKANNNNKPWMSVFEISDLFVICFVKLDKHLFWWSSCFWSCIIRSLIEWYGVWEIPVASSTLWCCLQLHLQLLARIPPLWYLYRTHGISEIQCLQVSGRFFSMHSCIISKCGLKFRALRIVFIFMLLMSLKGGSSTSWQCSVSRVLFVFSQVVPTTIWPCLMSGDSVMAWYEHLGRFSCLLCRNHHICGTCLASYCQTAGEFEKYCKGTMTLCAENLWGTKLHLQVQSVILFNVCSLEVCS
jgi:hypothetical protein